MSFTLLAAAHDVSAPLSLGWGNSSSSGVGFLTQNGVLVPTKAEMAPPVAAQGATAVASSDIVGLALKNGQVIEWTKDGQVTPPAETQSGVTAISAGVVHLMALKGGKVIDWDGGNYAGLNNPPAEALSGVSAIAAGAYNALALKNGGVIAWGDNQYGQSTVPDAAKSGVIAIDAGYDHSVALKSDGSVVAWGSNGFGQTSVPDAAKSGVVAIAAGNNHNLALKSDGTIVAWGRDNWNQLEIPALQNVQGIFAGGNTSMVLVPTTTPTISVSAKKADGTTYTAGTWTNQNVTLHSTCDDPGGGGIYACPEDVVISNEGEFEVDSTAVNWIFKETTTTFGPIRIDKTAPTVTLTSAAANPTKTSPIPVTAQFSEAVTDFAAADIVAGNAIVNNFVAVDGDTYTFDLVPSGQGPVTANLAAGKAVDRANNGNTAASQFSRTYDSVPPTVTITKAAAQTDPTTVAPVVFTATFSEDVSNFATGDVSFTGSTAGGTLVGTVSGGPKIYTVTVTGMTSGGVIKASIGAGVAQDAAGNGNTASSNTDNTVSFLYVSQVDAAAANATYGAASVTLTASVTSSYTVNGGTVTFTVKGPSPSSATVGTATSGATRAGTASATFSLAGIGAGTYTVGASYSGSEAFTSSSDATPATLTIGKATTSVANVAAAPSRIPYGTAAATLGASVTNESNNAALTSGGELVFRVTDSDGSVLYCTSAGAAVSGSDPVSVSNIACTFTSLIPPGNWKISADYNGSANFIASSGSGSLAVDKAKTTTVVGTPLASCASGSATVPVTITNADTGAALTGGSVMVTLKQGNTTLGTGSASVGGAASVTVYVTVPLSGPLPLGSLTTDATYSGDTNFLASNAATLTTSVPKTAATVAVQAVTATYGDSGVTLTATVTSVNGGPLTGGTVTFVVKKGTQIMATLTSGAVAGASPKSVSVSLPLSAAYDARSYTVEAAYGGNACFNPGQGTGTLTVGRKVLWVKPTDRTVKLKQANPATDPHGDPACPAPNYCLQLTRDSSFAYGQSWSALNLSVLRFSYSRNPPSTNATEYVGKTYRVTAFGATSGNYDLRYEAGTMTVVAAP
ncbi:MAG: Ig-like domain repeat protein [Thermomicrobiales bacterium]